MVFSFCSWYSVGGVQYAMKTFLPLFALSVTLGARNIWGGLILCYAGNPACPDEIAWTNGMNSANHLVSSLETFSGVLLPSTGVSQVGGNHGSILNNTWRDSVINNPGATLPNLPLQTTTFWYKDGSPDPAAVWGFGANFDTGPGHGGHASGIAFTLDVGGQIFLIRHFTGGFFGAYVTEFNERFRTLTLGTQLSCDNGQLVCTGWEIFAMDNLRFALDSAEVQPPVITFAPEPRAFTTLGTALAGLISLRYRRRKN